MFLDNSNSAPVAGLHVLPVGYKKIRGKFRQCCILGHTDEDCDALQSEEKKLGLRLHWSEWILQVFGELQKKRTGLMLRAEFLQHQSWAHQPGLGRAAVGPPSARGVGAYSAAAPLLSLSDQEWGLQMGAAGGRHLEQPPFSGSR